MKTRVMILIQHLTNGGVERAASLWSQMLVDTGYEVTLLTYYPLPNEYPIDSRVIRASLVDSFEKYTKLENKPTVRKKLLAQYLTKHPQDILLPFSINANLLAALSVESGVKTVTQTIRNSPWDKEQGINLALRDWAIQKQGVVILQNAEQLAYFNTTAFEHVKKYVVHNPLHPDIAKIKKTHYQSLKKIVAVGRLVPQKNHDLMIEAIRILRDEFHENYQLDIYGTGELHDTLQAQINAANLKRQVQLCGRSDNIFQTLTNYDLFLMTSSYEGTPNALLEAMGLGLPSLAIQCRTGITELINDDKNGYLLQGYDAHALATKIHEINSPTKLAQIGKQARKDMQRYALKNVQAELVTVMQDLLANPPQPTAAPLGTALQQCKFEQPADYQNYFEASLQAIKMANYQYGQQIFDQVRRTLQKHDVVPTSDIKTIYRICLQSNQFDVFYAFLQKTTL